MKIRQYIYQPDQGWRLYPETPENNADNTFDPDILLAFGSGKECNGDILVNWWQTNYPKAQLLGCSSAGEILDTEVFSNTISLTAIEFEKTRVQLYSIDIKPEKDSRELANELIAKLDTQDLKLCFVLSDGLNINGSQLVEGMRDKLPETCLLTGGLAGDGIRFKETLVCLNEDYASNKIVLLGLYGDNIEVEYGSMGGWSSFGPSRLVTRSVNNVLYDVDNQNALELYKQYLGPHAKELPASALRFPLLITTNDGKKYVRTILSVDEEAGTMTFAGDIPEGAYAELMRANVDRLVDGAADAAQESMQKKDSIPDLAILISCVGRRLVLGQRIEEEVEAVRDVFGKHTRLTGFYSYGEICPYEDKNDAMLHNQTMTITTLRERD